MNLKIKNALVSLSDKVSFINGPTFIEVIIRKGARDNLGRPKNTPIENKKLFMENIQ